MTYGNDELKAILDDIIINVYGRNPSFYQIYGMTKERETILISCMFNMKIS